MMFQRGGIFLLFLLYLLPVVAQDKMAQVFRHDNPNLLNLNEPTQYTGEPLVYIQGVKAPEKATNEMEALQLKLFGTKNVNEATKNTLELSPNVLPDVSENQIQNFIFQTPFHQTIEAGFIRHIPAFFVLIQVLDQQYLTVTESVTVMNTEENTFWNRTIPLATGVNAQPIRYTQNNESFSIPVSPQYGTLFFQASKPLELGPNQISFTYQLTNPFKNNLLSLQLTGFNIPWPIADLRVAVLFPQKQQIQKSYLTFGKNNLEIPDIYTQQMDFNSNINFQINRVIPPNASIHLQIELNPQFSQSNNSFISENSTHIDYLLPGILGGILLLAYWLVFAWWEQHHLNKKVLKKIKFPSTLCVLAHQMGTSLNTQKWKQLLNFAQRNNCPMDQLVHEHNRWHKCQICEQHKAALTTFITLIFEPFLGTFILLSLIAGMYLYAAPQFLAPVLSVLLCISVPALMLLYFYSLKKTCRLYWQKRLHQYSNPAMLLSLTVNQTRQIYPLFVLAQTQQQFQNSLIKNNPQTAQMTHLDKEEE